jgi:hypothetical protein
MTGVHHHTQLIGWDGVSLTFCPSWPQTSAIFRSSASRVAGITGVSHSIWPQGWLFWNEQKNEPTLEPTPSVLQILTPPHTPHHTFCPLFTFLGQPSLSFGVSQQNSNLSSAITHRGKSWILMGLILSKCRSQQHLWLPGLRWN